MGVKQLGVYGEQSILAQVVLIKSDGGGGSNMLQQRFSIIISF